MFFCLTPQWREGLFWEACSAEGREERKHATPTSAQSVSFKNPPSSGLWQQKEVVVTTEGGELSRSVWPQHPLPCRWKGLRAGLLCCSRAQALFVAAPFKEEFPGVAQSVTFVRFLRSALLNYFLSKRPRNLIGEMRRWARPGRIIKKNCHFPGCSFVGPPACWDKGTAAGLGSVSKGWFGCLIIYEI